MSDRIESGLADGALDIVSDHEDEDVAIADEVRPIDTVLSKACQKLDVLNRESESSACELAVLGMIMLDLAAATENINKNDYDMDLFVWPQIVLGRLAWILCVRSSPPLNEAGEWLEFGRKGGGMVQMKANTKIRGGRMYTREQCFIQYIEKTPDPAVDKDDAYNKKLRNKKAWAWAVIGDEGGAVPAHQRATENGDPYGERNCYSRALELNPNDRITWSNFGQIGGGHVDGVSVSALECFIKVLAIAPQDGWAWCKIFYELKPSDSITVNGERFNYHQCIEQVAKVILKDIDDADMVSAVGNSIAAQGTDVQNIFTSVCGKSAIDCLVRATEMSPNSAAFWSRLGWWSFRDPSALPHSMTPTECIKKSLSIGSRNASWHALGTMGGGTVKVDEHQGERYVTPKECFIKAIEENATAFDFWADLGNEGGGTVNGQDYIPAECYAEAMKLALRRHNVNKHYNLWNNLGVVGGGEVPIAVAEWMLKCSSESETDEVKKEEETENKVKRYTPHECYVLALEIGQWDWEDAAAWCNFGNSGGGTVRGQHYTAEECFRKCLEIDPENQRAESLLHMLSSIGGQEDSTCAAPQVRVQDTLSALQPYDVGMRGVCR